ncbi:hypothetical protein Sjap_006407 [Stephania japonica]|uniref:Protein FLX-like 2 n=1 Tax=Stephania japonica TaxID=461633 RepID=A0AAP0K7F3_9MAGN
MGSKGRAPPHSRRPLPGSGMMHPDPFGPSIHPPPGPYPPFDMLPPPEIMEQKLAGQHVEIQRLATENQRLAATHVTLRQELAAAQQELQRLQAQIGAMRNEKDQQMRGLVDKMAKVEVDLQAADSLKMELQQAHGDAHSLMAARQELITKVQQLTQDHQRTLSDVQQVPVLMSELEGLRQEYHHCRATYDMETKTYNDHYQNLQVMEKNYYVMSREVEKLRAELANAANLERRTVSNQNATVPYGGTASYKDNETVGQHPVGQNAYEDGYGVSQGRASASGAAAAAAAAARYAGVSAGSAPYSGAPAVSTTYNAAPAGSAALYSGTSVGTAPQRSEYDPSRASNYDAARGPAYDPARVTPYDTSRTPGYDAARGAPYDPTRASGYEAPSRSAVGLQGQAATTGSNVPYGSPTPPSRVAPAYEASTQSRGVNPARR